MMGALLMEKPRNAAIKTKSTYIMTECAATPRSPTSRISSRLYRMPTRDEEMLLISSDAPLPQACKNSRIYSPVAVRCRPERCVMKNTSGMMPPTQ